MSRGSGSWPVLDALLEKNVQHAYHTTNAASTAPSLHEVMNRASRNAKNVKFPCLYLVFFPSFSFPSFLKKGKKIQKDRGKQMYTVIKHISKLRATHIFKGEVSMVCNYLTQRK